MSAESVTEKLEANMFKHITQSSLASTAAILVAHFSGAFCAWGSFGIGAALVAVAFWMSHRAGNLLIDGIGIAFEAFMAKEAALSKYKQLTQGGE